MSDTLIHFGIKGMKWGVRRKRGTDGRVKGSSGPPRGKNAISKMSDSELRQHINRLQLERQYSQLNPTRVDSGRRAVSKWATNMSMQIVNQQVSKYANRGIDTAIDALFGEGTANPKKKKK